ncbi:chloroplast envelope membrane protein isoform X2 [Macadamia integrifolia]|uniref:chloroplast envelope membrane protein isoform X2 n=1 Tax=Macadamia integrifolia TaxID=60698 RepID=UPI001C4FDAAD|nr:chloroplast envelope membrane protein isoform X2 [Macadamia integrifolia]
MFLMSTSMVLCESFILFNRGAFQKPLPSHHTSTSLVSLTCGRRRLCGLIPNAKNGHSRKRTWWQKFFFDEDGNWLGLKEDDMLEDPDDASQEEISEGDKFEAWKRRAEAITELREAQEEMTNAESREWEDWLVGGTHEVNNSSWSQDWGDGIEESRTDEQSHPNNMMPEKSFVESVTDLVLGKEDDLLYEDRVFRYASTNSAKFLAVLVIIPCTLDFVVHDYILMPFLDRLELRDEWRLENRRTFANIWSDMVFGISLFILLYFNQSKVALLKFTGYKILNNTSDTGKAFLIILITDIFLGYHSESGWQTLLEVILEHYGLEVDPSVMTLFICLVPVIIDACVKLWLFKFLPRLSPKVANIFREMKRH